MPRLVRAKSAGAWASLAVAMTAVATGVGAEDKTRTGQNLLAVDWTDGELAAFRSAAPRTLSASSTGLPALQIPVLAFSEVPQIVKNVAGPDAKLTKPRSVILDAKEPYWYQIVDTYDGITVTVDADRRINHEEGKGFRIGAARNGAEATLGSKAQQKISIFDNSSEEGMEGVMIEYTVQKFPNIPYTVTIECSTKAKSQCKDLAVITKDQALLRVIAAGKS
jgi:hypothetical protein